MQGGLRASCGVLTSATKILVLLNLFSCGAADLNRQVPSKPLVTNGSQISSDEFPEVVHLNMGSTCSGTFIHAKIILTAAHCIKDYKTLSGELRPKLIRVYDYQSNGKRVSYGYSHEAVRHPKWESFVDKGYSKVNRYDLALVYLENANSPKVAERIDRAPRSGDEFTIVGFGDNHYKSEKVSTGSGKKRIGFNELTSTWGGMLRFNGTPYNGDAGGEDSASAPGDSGGPLFIDGALAGVTSGGYIFKGKKYSSYVNIYAPENRDFINQTMQAFLSP